MTKEGLPAAQALISLFEVTGNMDIPGGMIAPPDIMNYGGGWGTDFQGNDLLSQEQAAKRIGLDQYSLLRFGFQMSHPDLTFQAIKTGKPYQIRAAYIHQNNFLACMAPQPKEAAEVIAEKLEFIVCADIFLTPTIMAVADIVLPAQTFPERDGLRFGDGIQRGETINKVTQIGECKSDMEICLELGRRFNPEAWPWDNVREMFDHMISNGIGMSFEEVREIGPVFIHGYGWFTRNHKRCRKRLWQRLVWGRVGQGHQHE